MPMSFQLIYRFVVALMPNRSLALSLSGILVLTRCNLMVHAHTLKFKLEISINEI